MPKTRNYSSQREVLHVIFDVDGTLVDNLDLIVKSFNFSVANIVGREYSREEVYSRFGPTLEQMVEDVVPADRAKDAVRRYHAYYGGHFHQYAHAYGGVTELVSGLRGSGINVSVCTASDARMTKTSLEESGLQEMFSVVVTADDVTELKPSPEGLIRAIRLMSANPDATVYLGDAVRDIEASRRAGIMSAAALWGFGNGNELKAHRPDFVFRNPADALEQFT
jgi:pyrophosphatase PpaX